MHSYIFPSELWLDPSWYAFTSSAAGSIVEKVILGLLVYVVWRRIRKHYECDVEAPENCHDWGHVVPGTGHRACHAHHPHAEGRGAITADDILRHHEDSRDEQPQPRPAP